MLPAPSRKSRVGAIPDESPRGDTRVERGPGRGEAFPPVWSRLRARDRVSKGGGRSPPSSLAGIKGCSLAGLVVRIAQKKTKGTDELAPADPPAVLRVTCPTRLDRQWLPGVLSQRPASDDRQHQLRMTHQKRCGLRALPERPMLIVHQRNNC
jgi:hypothetical protein